MISQCRQQCISSTDLLACNLKSSPTTAKLPVLPVHVNQRRAQERREFNPIPTASPSAPSKLAQAESTLTSMASPRHPLLWTNSPANARVQGLRQRRSLPSSTPTLPTSSSTRSSARQVYHVLVKISLFYLVLVVVWNYVILVCRK
jgi:hypothetical protein